MMAAQKLFWIDMEMTGLNVEKEVIIEVAALITDFDFQVLDSWETVVQQPQKYIDGMDAWNTKHHGESGLTAKIPSGMPPLLAEDRLIEMARRHFPEGTEKPMLAGNSIAQDRLFITKHMPRFDACLHYRMLDVSSWKIIFNNKFGLKYEKKNAHRAVDDILESVAELKFYLSHLKR